MGVIVSSIFDITVELVESQRRAKKYKEDEEKYKKLAEKWLKERDKINSEIGNLLNKAKEEREIRNKYNNKVKELKKKKIDLKNKLKIHQEKINKLKLKLDKIPSKELKRIMRVKSQIKNLEWQYQTSVINPEQEKEIINQIEKLERSIEDKIEIINLLEKFELELSKIRELEKKIKNLQSEIIEIANKSQVHHINMVNIYNKIDSELRPKAKEAHKKYLEMSKMVDECILNFLSLKQKIKILKAKLIQKRNDYHKISTIIESRVEKALEKMKEGKRLTLDEFQLLVKSGLL